MELSKLNGMLLPGGAGSLKGDSAMFIAIKNIVKIAIEFNDDNEYFPVFGTCLGFQGMLKSLIGDDDFKLDRINDTNASKFSNLIDIF